MNDNDIELKSEEFANIGEGFYAVKDGHFIYLCVKKHGSTDWPKGLRKVITITPGVLKSIQALAKGLKNYKL